MYHIIDKTGTGKTNKLIHIAKIENAPVICADPDKMRKRAYDYGITGVDYISYEEYLNNPSSYERVLIDNLDKCYPNIIAYTSTVED